MTPADLQSELEHREITRLGILCGDKEPTEAQREIVRLEIEQTEKELKDARV